MSCDLRSRSLILTIKIQLGLLLVLGASMEGPAVSAAEQMGDGFPYQKDLCLISGSFFTP